MNTYTNKGDTIKGDRVIAEARKIHTARIINKSGRHKAQQIILKDNVKCVIDKELKHIPQ